MREPQPGTRDGAPRWMHRLGGGGFDIGGRVAVGPGNDVVVAADSAERLTLARFAADGTTRFATDIGKLTPSTWFAPIAGVAVDLHGDIVVAGYFYGDADLGGGAITGVKGEQAWVQILIQAHRKEGLLDARVVAKPDWTEAIKGEIKKIIEKEALIKPEKDKPATMMNLTDLQKETIKSIERNAAKLAYDAMIRMVYVGEKEVFDKGKAGGRMANPRHYAHLIEFGTKHHRAFPFIKPAFQEERSKAQQIIVRKTAEGLERAARRAAST